MIGRINTQISGSSTDPTLNTGGMNQQIATNTTAITTNAAAAKLVANLTPGSLGQKMQVDVVAAVNTPVWYDPATDIYYTSASGTQSYGGAAQAVTLDIGINLPPGTWLVFAVLSGQFYFASAGATYAAYMSVVVGGSGTLVSPKTFVNNAGAGYCGALHLMQTITIPKASGNQTISVSVTTGSGTIVNTSGTFLNLLFKRVKLGV